MYNKFGKAAVSLLNKSDNKWTMQIYFYLLLGEFKVKMPDRTTLLRLSPTWTTKLFLFLINKEGLLNKKYALRKAFIQIIRIKKK